jgi:hypothetical protein
MSERAPVRVIDDDQHKIDAFRRDYNGRRSHRAFKSLTDSELGERMLKTFAGSLVNKNGRPLRS